MMKVLAPIVAVAILTSGVTLASEGHAHESPHGGKVATAGKYHIEIVKTKVGYDVFLLDEKEVTLPVTGFTGTAIGLKADKKKVEMKLMEGADRLMIMTDPETLEGGTLIVTLHKGAESASAKFQLVEDHHDGAEHHD